MTTAGWTYEGQWCDGKKVGFGHLVKKASGEEYEGPFENDKVCGWSF